MAQLGYARVSTFDQHLDQQVTALTDAGCERLFTEKATGTRSDRPELSRLLEYAREGDVVVVWKLDRLGRSLRHLLDVVGDLQDRGIGFRSLTEQIDTTTSTGRLVFNIFAALAEFERDLIVDRTKAGLAAARARGARPGRKPALSSDQVAVVRQMHSSGEHTVEAIAKVVGVSRATIYRALPTTDLPSEVLSAR